MALVMYEIFNSFRMTPGPFNKLYSKGKTLCGSILKSNSMSPKCIHNPLQPSTMTTDDWLTDWLTELTDCLTDWLTAWLTDWIMIELNNELMVE